MTKILVLGASGMLGHTVSNVLKFENLSVTDGVRASKTQMSSNSEVIFNATNPYSMQEKYDLAKFDFVINCSGMIKQKTNENNPDEIDEAIKVNSLFPIALSDMASTYGFKVIQIATDCVYDGSEGQYTENSLHNATDVYGKTKSLGEVRSKNVMNIRTSIVGIENMSSHSLLSWFLSQKEKAKIEGYINHLWNGVTTYHFSKVLAGIINNSEFEAGTFHLVPEETTSKYQLLSYFSRDFNRQDVEIIETINYVTINRTLSTLYPALNIRLWRSAGYTEPQSISSMVREYSEWSRRIHA
jgi:dTDP-4-dehydrorhamnose reductase